MSIHSYSRIISLSVMYFYIKDRRVEYVWRKNLRACVSVYNSCAFGRSLFLLFWILHFIASFKDLFFFFLLYVSIRLLIYLPFLHFHTAFTFWHEFLSVAIIGEYFIIFDMLRSCLMNKMFRQNLLKRCQIYVDNFAILRFIQNFPFRRKRQKNIQRNLIICNKANVIIFFSFYYQSLNMYSY